VDRVNAYQRSEIGTGTTTKKSCLESISRYRQASIGVPTHHMMLWP
jgi:hypothetical protein